MTLLISTLHVLAIAGCAFWVWRKEGGEMKALFWPALSVKLAAGIGLGLIYLHYYTTGDTFIFFAQAREQAHLFFTDPRAYADFITASGSGEWKGSDRSMFLVKVISVFAVFTNGNYWITSLWFSFVSFLGAWYLVGVIEKSFSGSGFAAALAFLFFPSVVFWSSGIIKECLAFAALMTVSGVYLTAMRKRPGGSALVLAVLALWTLVSLKYYWAAVFIPLAGTSLLVHYTSLKWDMSPARKLTLGMTVFFALVLTVSFLHPNFHPDRFLSIVVDNNHAFTAISDSGNLIHYYHLNATWWSILINSPWALASGLFRPWVWEADNIWKALTAFENLVVLVLFLSSLGHLKNGLRHILLVSMIAYIVLLCVFLALSTPNLGSLARYKVGFMPFLVFLIAYKNPLIDALLSFRFKKQKND